MFYIDFTAPNGKTYRIDVSKNPVIYKTNVPSAGRLQFTSLIQPIKILVSPAMNTGYGRKRNGKMNLWRIGFILNLQNFSVSKKTALFPKMRLNVCLSLQTKNKKQE